MRVAVAHAGGMGMAYTAAGLAVLCDRYNPKYLAMAGVCAGRPDKTSLGDVVAGERLDVFDSGKELPEGKIQTDPNPYELRLDWKVALEAFCPADHFRKLSWWNERPIPLCWQEMWVLWQVDLGAWPFRDHDQIEARCPQWDTVISTLLKDGRVLHSTDSEECPFTLSPDARAFIKAEQVRYRGRFPDLSSESKLLPFRLHVAPMATGNRVCEDKQVWCFVTDHMRKTLGLEMEAAAVGRVAAMARSKPDALVMKGVMDFADHGRDDHFKGFAARASAECLLEFLRQNATLDHDADVLVESYNLSPVTELEQLNQAAIVELMTVLSHAWGVDEAGLRIEPLLQNLAVLRGAEDPREIETASRKLRPYLGNSVRSKLPKTERFISMCLERLPEGKRQLLRLF